MVALESDDDGVMAKIIQAEGSGTIKVFSKLYSFLFESKNHLYSIYEIHSRLKRKSYQYFFDLKVGKLIAVLAEDGEDWKEVAQTAGENITLQEKLRYLLQELNFCQ